MGKALEVVSGFVVNPSTTITALTAATGDQFAVRNFTPPDRAFICDQWALGATKGITQTTSPRLHDNVAGIRNAYGASLPVSLLTGYEQELLYPQDTIAYAMSGDASDTDGLTTLIYYTNLPGTDARLYRWDEIRGRVLHTSGVQLALTTGAAKGNYGGATQINATQNQFKANTDYAILGYNTDVSVQTVGIRSADFGNLRVGGPGSSGKLETRDWFLRLGRTIDLPTIPVFNAANVSNTIVDLIHNATSTAVVVTFTCLELSTPGGATS